MEDRLIGKDFDGIYILRSLLLLEDAMLNAAEYLDEKLFLEYWGDDIGNEIDIHSTKARILYWLQKADEFAREWTPSDYLFLNIQNKS